MTAPDYRKIAAELVARHLPDSADREEREAVIAAALRSADKTGAERIKEAAIPASCPMCRRNDIRSLDEPAFHIVQSGRKLPCLSGKVRALPTEPPA